MCRWYQKTSEDYRILLKSKRVHKRELNNISGWLEYSLKGSRAWKIGWVNECKYGNGSWNMNQPKNIEEERLRRVCPLIPANNIKLISNKHKK